MFSKKVQNITINITQYRSHSSFFLFSLPLFAISTSEPIESPIPTEEPGTPVETKDDMMFCINLNDILSLIPYLQYIEDKIYLSYCCVSFAQYVHMLIDTDPVGMRNTIVSSKDNIKSTFYLMNTPVIEHQEIISGELAKIFHGYNYDAISYEVLLYIFHYTLKHNVRGILEDVAATLITQANNHTNSNTNYFLSKYKADSESTIMTKILSIVEADYIKSLKDNFYVNKNFLTTLTQFFHDMIMNILRQTNKTEIQLKLIEQLIEDLISLMLHNTDVIGDGLVCDSLYVLCYNNKLCKTSIWEFGDFTLSMMFKNVVDTQQEEIIDKALHLFIELSEIPYIKHAMYENGILFSTLTAIPNLTNIQTLILAFQLINNLIEHPVVACYYFTYFFKNYTEFVKNFANEPLLTYELIRMSEIIIPSPMIAVHIMYTCPEYIQLLTQGINNRDKYVRNRTERYLHKIFLGENNMYILLYIYIIVNIVRIFSILILMS